VNLSQYKKLTPARRESNRRRAKRYYWKNREKDRARKIFKRALISGELIRMPCEVCGALESEGHHEDYSKPLEVRWLCRPHHNDVHYPERVAAKQPLPGRN
jgi:hypothetical protein